MSKIDFHLVDQKIKNISQTPGVVLLSSPEAWKKYPWTRKFFTKRPQLGYFLWAKKSPRVCLSSCISLASCGLKQELTNLIVVEPGVKARIMAACNALTKTLGGIHIGKSKVVVKEKGFLEIIHQHSWGGKDIVSAKIDFFVKKGASLNYVYKNLSTPKRLEMRSRIYLKERAKADSQIIIEAEESKIGIDETLLLKNQDAGGSLALRLVGKRKADIKAVSKIVAQDAGRGHLDCQGLLVDKKAKISLTPKLINKNHQALITHEASIGRIEKEKLEYLQSRGLSEEKAINLLVKGFLNK